MMLMRRMSVVGVQRLCLLQRNNSRPRLEVVRSFAKKGKKNTKPAPKVAEAIVEEEEEEEEEEEDEGEDDDILGDAYAAKLKNKMKKTADHLESQFGRMRGSTPTPELFESARVEAYGSMEPLSSVAQVLVKSATMVECHCFDPDLAPAVSNALKKMDGLSLNPSVDGSKLTIPFPRPSVEAREVVAKAAAKAAEKAKGKIRQIRHKARDDLKKVAKTYGEEDVRRRNTWIDTIAEDTNKKLAALLDSKKNQILGDKN